MWVVCSAVRAECHPASAATTVTATVRVMVPVIVTVLVPVLALVSPGRAERWRRGRDMSGS